MADIIFAEIIYRFDFVMHDLYSPFHIFVERDQVILNVLTVESYIRSGILNYFFVAGHKGPNTVRR